MILSYLYVQQVSYRKVALLLSRFGKTLDYLSNCKPSSVAQSFGVLGFSYLVLMSEILAEILSCVLS